jgi:group I intron endonuclease
VAFIYKITNKINGKIYIGKTLKTIEGRWKDHLKDYKRPRFERRPLYSAMKKYGVENFSIEEVEECSSEILSEREIYWIDFYDSFRSGYNATKGGDGKPFIDEQEILKLWKDGKSLKDIAEVIGHSRAQTSQLLRNNGILSEDIIKRGHNKYYKSVKMIDINANQVLAIFPSTREAARYLIKELKLSPSNEGGISSHISEACRGKRKTCQGYKWQYCYL